MYSEEYIHNKLQERKTWLVYDYLLSYYNLLIHSNKRYDGCNHKDLPKYTNLHRNIKQASNALKQIGCIGNYEIYPLRTERGIHSEPIQDYGKIMEELIGLGVASRHWYLVYTSIPYDSETFRNNKKFQDKITEFEENGRAAGLRPEPLPEQIANMLAEKTTELQLDLDRERQQNKLLLQELTSTFTAQLDSVSTQLRLELDKERQQNKLLQEELVSTFTAQLESLKPPPPAPSAPLPQKTPINTLGLGIVLAFAITIAYAFQTVPENNTHFIAPPPTLDID